MSSRVPAQIALAVVTAWCASPAIAQDTGDFRSPRPRVGQVSMERQDDAPPKLGVMVSEEEDGVFISEVVDGSLAASAGIQADDILFKINGQRVSTISDIPEILGSTTEPGSDVHITVIRSGEGLVTLSGTREAPHVEWTEDDHGGEWIEETHEKAFLGVGLGESDAKGATIGTVYDGTSAWFAGLQEGDVITRFGEESVDSGETLAELVGETSAGQMIGLVWKRDGEKMKSRIRLGHKQPEGNPLGMSTGPGGNIWFSDDDDFSFSSHAEFPFAEGSSPFGEDGNVLFFTNQNGDVDVENIHEWAEHMQEWAHEFEGDMHEMHGEDGHNIFQFKTGHGDGHEPRVIELNGDGGESNVEVRIEDGKLYIEQDGETKVIDLSSAESGADGASYQVLGDGAAFMIPAESGASVVIQATTTEAPCEAQAECAPSPECEASVECEPSPECEASVECEEPVEEVIASSDLT